MSYLIKISVLIIVFVLNGCSQPIPLTFDAWEELYIPNVIDQQSITIVNEINLEKHTFILFYNREDKNEPKNLFAGLKTNESVYNLGEVGYGEDLNLIDIEPMLFGDQTIYKITGFCGASCHITSYDMVDDLTVQTILRLTSPTIEVDLNKDGRNEIISSYGTAQQTEIYKLNDENTIDYVSLNKVLNAISVQYDEKRGLFEAYFEGKIMKSYKYVDGALLEV